MEHATDDIRVGAIRLHWLEEKQAWLLPWGMTTSNPLKAHRLAEELNEKRNAGNE